MTTAVRPTVQRSPAAGAPTTPAQPLALTQRTYPAAPLTVPTVSRRQETGAAVQRNVTAPSGSASAARQQSAPAPTPTTSTNTVIQRAATAPSDTAAAPVPTADPASGGSPMSQLSRQDMDQLARDLIGPLSRLLRAELRLDRERNGRLRDH